MVTVLHIIERLTLGGASRSLLAVSKYSARSGKFEHRVLSLLPPVPEALKLAEESSVPLVNATDCDAVHREIESADIVHINWWNAPCIQTLLHSELPAMRLLNWYHVSGDGSPQIITPEMVALADWNIPTNPATCNDVPVFRDRPRLPEDPEATMIYDPADFDRLKGLKRRRHKGFNVGYIGTVDFYKMHPNFVPMSAEVQIPDVKFLVCGGGIQERLKQQATQLGASERFEFLGYVQDIREVISVLDVYGYPLCEGTYASGELNLQEVMYAGIPPVVFPYGGVRGLIIDNYTGLVVHTEREYRQAIEFLHQNPQERKRLGKNAAEFSKQLFGAENAAAKLNPIYQRMLGKPKRLRERLGTRWLQENLGSVDTVDSQEGAPFTGAEIFINSLGESGEAFRASYDSSSLESAFTGDQEIAQSSELIHRAGILEYSNAYSSDHWLRLWSGLIYSDREQDEQAFREFTMAARDDGAHWRVFWYLALSAEKCNRIPVAMEALDKVLSVDPQFTRAIELKQRLETTVNRESRISNQTVDSEVVNQHSGDQSMRDESRRTSSSTELKSYSELLDKADDWHRKGELQQAWECLQKAGKLDDSDSELLKATAHLAYQLQYWDESVQFLNKLLSRDSKDVPSLILRASSELKMECYESAQESIDQARAILPDDRDVLMMAGEIHQEKKEYSEAARILQSSPEDIQVILSIGKCFKQVGDSKSARMSFEEVLKLESGHAEASALINSLNTGNEFRESDSGPAGESLSAGLRNSETKEDLAGDYSKPPLITVLVSTFNGEKYIKGCLEDLEKQTLFSQLEILVIDSGSSQNEGEIVKSFQRRCPNIRYIRTEERETLYQAWNRGIDASRGRYVVNANIDDARRADAFELLEKSLESNPEASLAYGDCAWTSKPNDAFPSENIIRTVQYPDYHPALSLFYCFTGCLQFWRKSALDNLNGFQDDLTAVGDYEILMRLVEKKGRVVHVPEVLSLFFQNTEGITQNSNRSAVEEQQVRSSFRGRLEISHFFEIGNGKSETKARAWVGLGLYALNCRVPWHDSDSGDDAFAIQCFQKSVEICPDYFPAANNLLCLLRRFGREEMGLNFLKNIQSNRSSSVTEMLEEGDRQLIQVSIPSSVVPIRCRPGELNEVCFEELTEKPKELPVADEVSDPAVTAPKIMPVRWVAPFFNPSGYAGEAIDFALPLAERPGFGIVNSGTIRSESFLKGRTTDERERLNQLEKAGAKIRGGIILHHGPGGNFSWTRDAEYFIGRTMFETDRIPRSWVTSCNRMDEIWVPTEFNRDTFSRSGVEPDKIRIIPGAVDENHFNPQKHRALNFEGKARFNFLAVFEWIQRKGWDVLLNAYLNEFSNKDDVCLFLRTYLRDQPDGDATQLIRQKISEHAVLLGLDPACLPRIEILAEQIASKDLPGLYLAMDCLVAPSRGEGWGRPQHEAMMMGLPVIATGWGGTMQFMNRENSYLLDYELKEITDVEPLFWDYRGHQWAEPDTGHLKTLMRHLAENPEEASIKGQTAFEFVRKHYSKKAVGIEINRRLNEISESIGAYKKVSKLSNNGIPVLSSPKRSHSKNRAVRVSWQGSFLDYGSLSHVNRELMKCLDSVASLKMTWIGKNHLKNGFADHPDLKRIASRLKGAVPKDTQVEIRHQWPPDFSKSHSGSLVMMQPWEFGVLPMEWIRQSNHVDQFWVYSEYVRKVYVNSGIHPDKVKVIPLGIDPDRFTPQAQPLDLPTNNSFRFLFVGGTIPRKGPDILLDSYLQSFKASDDVCLVIKDFGGGDVYAGQTLKERIVEVSRNPESPEILYLEEEIDADKMAGLYTACHCLVHPYRGEGFGLPVLEAMACGLPVVVTAGGATDDFAGDEHAVRIPARKVSLETKIGEFDLERRGWWLEPDLQKVASAIQSIFNNKTEYAVLGRKASDYVRSSWTWQHAASCVQDAVLSLHRNHLDALDEKKLRQRKTTVRVETPDCARLGNLNVARESLKKRQWKDAWDETSRALEIRPFHPDAWLLRAEIAVSSGDLLKARSCIGRAKSMVPKWKELKKFGKRISGRGSSRKPAQCVLPGLSDSKPIASLSVCLITRNEEAFLEACLESVKGIAEQIVVMDTGSTDRTCEIAERFGAEVYRTKWTDDFSAARNEALQYVRGDWVLILDADEELSPEGRQSIQAEMNEQSVMAYRLPITESGHPEEGCSYVPRLFRNAPGLFFVGRVHEQIFSSVEVRRKPWRLKNQIGKSNLLHHGYSREVVQQKGKVERNLSLLMRAVEEMPNEQNLLLSLGNELIRFGKMEEGLQYCREAHELAMSRPDSETIPEFRETLITQFCNHLLTVREYEEAIVVLDAEQASNGKLTATMSFVRGLAKMNLGMHSDAVESYRQCMEDRFLPVLSPINKDLHKGAPQHCLAVCLNSLNQFEEAARMFEEAWNLDKRSATIGMDWAKFLAGRKQPIEAIKVLHQLVGIYPDQAGIWLLGGQIALGDPTCYEFALDWSEEACSHCSENVSLLSHYVLALLLNGKTTQAMEMENNLPDARDLDLKALSVIVALSAEQPISIQPGSEESVISQAFIGFYKQVVQAGNSEVVLRINGRHSDLDRILPTAGQIIRNVLKDVETMT